MIIPLTIAITIYIGVACFFGYVVYHHVDEFDIDEGLKQALPLFVIAWPVAFIFYFLIKNKII